MQTMAIRHRVMILFMESPQLFSWVKASCAVETNLFKFSTAHRDKV